MGQGPLRDEIREQARDLIESGYAHFLGTRDDLPELMAASDVLLFPSIREGFGLVALEGNAGGLAVVATRVPGLTEAVVDGETALLHELSDEAGMAASVIRLIEDKALAAKLGAAGRARAIEHFSHEASAKRLTDLYSSVLAARRS